MDPDLLVIFGSIGATAVALGGLGLVGLRMWLRGRSGPDPAHLHELVRDQVQVAIAQEVAGRDQQIEELYERLEFAERLLTEIRDRKRLEGPGQD